MNIIGDIVMDQVPIKNTIFRVMLKQSLMTAIYIQQKLPGTRMKISIIVI